MPSSPLRPQSNYVPSIGKNPLRPNGGLFFEEDLVRATLPETADARRGLASAFANAASSHHSGVALKAAAAGDAALEQQAIGQAELADRQAAIYAPRVSSLRDAQSIGDVGSFIAGAAPGVVVDALPALAVGLLTRGRGRLAAPTALAGAAVPSYNQQFGEMAREQRLDPTLSEASVEDRLRAARLGAAGGTVLEALLPGKLADDMLRGPTRSLLRNTFVDALTEGVTEPAQTGVQHLAHRTIDSTRELDGWDLLDSAVAGAAGGAGLSAATRAPAHGAQALVDRFARGQEGSAQVQEQGPAAEPPMDAAPPGTPPPPAPDDGSGGGMGGLFDTLNERFGPGLREQAQKTKDYVSDTIDRMGEAAKTAQSPSDFLRQVFGNSAEDAAADLRPDTEDPGVMNAADPAAALQQRDAERQERAARFAEELLSDPATPDAIKERVAGFGGDFSDPEAQAFVARNLVSQRAGEKLVNAVNGLIDLSKAAEAGTDLAAKARDMLDKSMTAAADRIVKKNLQDATPAEQATFNKLVFDSLTDEAKASPAVRQRLPELANAMLAFAARTGDLTKADLKTLSRMQDGLAMFRDPEQLAAQLTEYAGLPRTEDSFLSRVKRVTNAQQDILQPNSFLYSSLTEEAKDSLSQPQLRQLARLVDDFTLSDSSKAQGDKVLAGLAAAFGSKDAARSVLDYYQQQNRADLRFDPNEMLTEGGTTERDGAPAPTYQFADAKAMRPYRAFAGQMSSEGGMRRRLRESTIAGAALRRSSPGGARVRPVKMSQYVTDTGGNPEAEVKRIAADIKDRIDQHKARKGEDRSQQINQLQGELTLMRQAYKDGGAQAALDLYEVLQVSGQEQNDTIASDEDIAKMATLADAKDAKETRVTFQREDGSKFTLSAESMWKTLGDKEGSGKGENAQARAKRLFADAVASVLARPEVVGIVGTSYTPERVAKMRSGTKRIVPALTEFKPGLVIDRKLGVQAKKKGNPEYREMVSEALRAAEGSIKRLESTLDAVVDEYLDAADNEAKSEEYGSRREEIEGIIEKNIDQLSKRLDDAREGEGPMAGNMPAQAVARQKLRMYRDAQSQIDAVKFDEAFDERDNNRSGVPGAEDAPTDFSSEFRRLERERVDLQHAYDVAYDSGNQAEIASAERALNAVKERIKGVEAREATERSYGSAGWMEREGRGMGPRYAEEDTGLGVGVERRGQKQSKREAEKKETPSRVILPQVSRYAAKDQAKSDRANKFIGRGAPGSSTAAYAEAWGDRANVGEYSPEDTVFISVNGNRPGALSPPWPEIKKAMTGGATLITDVPADRARSFNSGERAVADFLDDNGYFEESPGTWVRGYDIDNATGQKRYAPLGAGASQQTPKTSQGKVVKKSLMGVKTGLDFDNKRVQDLLTAVGFYGWQDPELTGWGARNRAQAEYDAFQEHLTLQDVMTAAKMQRETGVKGGNNSDAGYVGLNYLRKKIAKNSGAGTGVPAYHKYIRQQMEGMPSVMERAWEEYDGDARVKAEWDKLSSKEKLAANARRIEAERADKAYDARMDAAGIPKQFRVRHTGMGMGTVGNYRGPDYLFYTEETADGVELGASRYFDPPDADDDPRDFTPEDVDLGTHPNMEAAEIAASKFLMSKAKQQPSGGPRGKLVKKSFVGAKSDPQGAADAEGLLNVGAPADVVWRELGWFRGPDGKLRKEVRSPVLRRRVRDLATAIAAGTAEPTTIGALLEGIDAFKPYLDKLGDAPVDPNDELVEMMGAIGAYGEGKIGLSRLGAEVAVRIEAIPDGKGFEVIRDIANRLVPEDLRDYGLGAPDPNAVIAEMERLHPLPDVEKHVADRLSGTLIHELQHAFQHVEGFSNGGNATTAVVAKYGDADGFVAAFRDEDEDTVTSIIEQAFAQLRAEVGPDGDMEAAAHELYESIVGEVEANDVAARMKLSDEEAASVKPALMDAKREFVRSVLLAEALSTVRAGLKKSAIGGRPGRPGKNWGDKDAVKAEILRLRGKDVKVKVEKLIKQLGGSGQYTYDPATGARLIEVAINARSPVGTARHEAMHDLFRFLSENDATRSVAKDLRDATSAPHVIRQLRELLKDHKPALEQLNDPEERAAYAYQFWAEGLLRIGPTGTGFFHTIRQFLKDLFGVVTAGQRGEDLMRAFHDGKFADPSIVQEVLQDINDSSGDRVANKLDRAAPALTRAVDSLLSAAPERLRRFENDYLNELADKFQPEKGTGFVQNKFQQEGVWTNRLGGILRGTTAVERREAIDQLQAMKPTSKLAKELAKFNEDIYEYMRDAGVQSWDSATKKFVPLRKVQGYFTRSWDPDAIARNRSEFEALLRTEGGVSAANAAALVENLVRGSEQRPKPKESPVELGFMPYAPHTSERVLTFIKPSNADKFAKFQRKDLADIMMSYVRGSTHRAEYAREFGNNGEKIVDLVTKSGVKDTKELGEISNAVQALEGSLDPGNWSVQTKEAMSALMTLQNVTLLPLAIMSQMIDPIVLAARTGDIKDAGTAYVTALKRLKNTIAGGKNKVPGEELAEILGVVSEDSTLQAMAMAYGTTRMSKRMENINRVFFKYNGMQGWNNSMRIAATAAGEKYLLAHKGDAKALAELGLEPKDVKVGKNGRLDVSSPKVQQAMFQFVDQAVLRPSAANRPVWMSDPRFLLVAHLKQFTHAMHNVVLKRASRELTDGNPKPWGILMLTMPVILAADMAKFALTGTGPSTWGFKDYLVHAVERSGLLGLGDFGVQAMRGVDMGKMPGEELLGPSFENLMEILRWIGGDPRTGVGDVIDRTVPGSRFI